MRYDLPIPARDSLRLYQRNASGKERIKVTSLLMLGNGLSVETVSDPSGMDVSTVYRYRNRYKELGLYSKGNRMRITQSEIEPLYQI